MKTFNNYLLNLMMVNELIALILGCLLCTCALAQTAPPIIENQTASEAPLNLDSGAVVKEISKEQSSTDTKPDVLTSTNTVFEQSMLHSENHKKITGIVETGVGVGNVPAQHGFKGADVTCENAGAAVNDKISSTVQVGISAYASTCKVR